MKSPLSGYLGGKSRLVKQLLEHIPDHECYCEVFCGAAWLFFAKDPDASRVEVLNDINDQLTNLYRCVQNHLEETVRQFKYVLISRDEFERLKRTDPSTQTDIQRAGRFYYLLRASFGGRPVNARFGTACTQPSRLNLLRIEEELSAAHIRLARTTVESLSWADCLAKYDRPATFFYLDPPYWGSESIYGTEFRREDFQALAAALTGIQGKFLLSINDCPEVREVFSGFKWQARDTMYSFHGHKAPKQVKELFITNY